MSVTVSINYCSECHNHKQAWDPDPDDSFASDSYRIDCKLANKNVCRFLYKREIGKLDSIPEWCPLKNK